MSLQSDRPHEDAAVLAALALPSIGATSYVIPSGLVENAAYLAQQVDDMQLVLFDVPDGPCNIPSPEAVAELARIGRHHDLSYTVHLIHDLVAHDPEHHALRKATDVIERTRALRPHAYVLHLDGKSVRSPETTATRITAWQQGQGRRRYIVLPGRRVTSNYLRLRIWKGMRPIS